MPVKTSASLGEEIRECWKQYKTSIQDAMNYQEYLPDQDPDPDTPPVLAAYAKTWGPNEPWDNALSTHCATEDELIANIDAHRSRSDGNRGHFLSSNMTDPYQDSSLDADIESFLNTKREAETAAPTTFRAAFDLWVQKFQPIKGRSLSIIGSDLARHFTEFCHDSRLVH